MSYTVHRLATLAGISSRTLRYYDQIGLLRPAGHGSDNGYRLYEKDQLIRLQQIMFFRELGFPLERIGLILDSPGFDANEALADQKRLLEAERKRLARLIRTIDLTIHKHAMTDKELYAAFGNEELAEYQEEVKEKWGNTEAYRQSQERARTWTKEDIAEIKAEGEEIDSRLASLMDSGFTPESLEAQEVVSRKYAHMGRFYDCPIAMFRGLADMWEADERFAATHEKIRAGYNVFLVAAVRHFCDNR